MGTAEIPLSRDGLVIFHVNTEKTFRGGEIQTLHLIRELQKRGHQNCIFARPGSQILKEARANDIPCFTLPMRGEWDLISARTLRRLIHVQRPDILHAHTAHACSIALMARWPDPYPPLVYSRRVAFPPKKRILPRKLKKVDAVIAVSQAVRKQLMEVGIQPEKIFVAESGTDFEMFDRAPDRVSARAQLGIPQNAFVIGNVSHFDEEKGQEKLIRAFCEFVKLHREGCLLLVGEGPTRLKCEEMARASECTENIIFVGYRADVEKLYPAMDIFFLSSSREGSSGVLREAMGSNVPIIAVRQPSTEEQVRSGVLVSPNETDWLDAICDLYDHRDKGQNLAAGARDHARQFTIAAMVSKTEECYKHLLKQKHAISPNSRN
jgi:L-malate glycosyltransferase